MSGVSRRKASQGGRDPSRDFRGIRQKLPPEAFAIAQEPEPAPTDLIHDSTWAGLTNLPDDVSLRTSDHHGELLRKAYDVWGYWIDQILDIQTLVDDPREDALALAGLTVTDELQASTYLVLTGFYRQAIAVLRSSLEGLLAGAYFRAFPNKALFEAWADGHKQGRLWVRQMREKLAKVAPYSLFEGEAHADCLLGESGWATFLYEMLSGFSHGRPFFVNQFGDRIPSSNVELWGGSNGPVYEPRSVRLWSASYFDVALLCVLLLGLAERRLVDLPRPVGMPYLKFVGKLFSWHWAPRPVAKAMAVYLGCLFSKGQA